MSLLRAEGGPEFRNALTELKRRGCNILITGNLTDEVLDHLCTDMLGRAPERRARIIALIGTDAEVARQRLRAAAPGIEPVIVIDTVEDPRAATVEQQIQHVNGELHVRTIEQERPVLEGALLQAISEFKTRHHPLDPAELRVSVDSLYPLSKTYDPDELERFVTNVGSGVVDARGMAHYVLRQQSDSTLVETLSSYFDARIEHRIIDGEFYQRWCIPEYDVETEWFRIT